MKKRSKINLIIPIILGLFFSLSVMFYTLDFNIGIGDKFSESRNMINLKSERMKFSQNHIYYTENFDVGVADQWETIEGTWIVESNQYKATGTGGVRVRSYYSGQSFNDYTYEGDLKLVSGNEINLIFNVQDIFPGVDQGHYCQITLFYNDPGGRKDTVVLYSTHNDQTEHTSVPYDFKHNQWYHFKVLSNGSYVAFFLDDSLIFSYSGLFYSSGYIGVKSMFGPTAYWDNITVSKIDESGDQFPLESGNPFPLEFLTNIMIVIVGTAIFIIITGVIVRKRIVSKDEVSRHKKLKELEIPKISNCPFCYAPINDKALFCKQCGSSFKKN